MAALAGRNVASDIAATLRKALAYHQGGQLDLAETLYRAILVQSPAQVDASQLLRVIEAERTKPAAGRGRSPRHASGGNSSAAAHMRLGNALRTLKRHEEALASYGRALALRPDYPQALYNRGNALRALKRHEDAVADYDRALALRPDYPQALSNRGNALRDLKRHEEALASYERLLVLTPDDAGTLNNRGIVLRALRRHEEALASFERALALRPDDAKTLNNHGNVLRALNRHEEALASYQRALALKPDYAGAHWNEALCRLLLGNFATGWQKYEWRWQRETFTSPQRDFIQPLWKGQQSLAGKTVLLHAEQGFGDTIQFCRYAGLVASQGATVMLEVQPPLRSLMSSLAGVARVLGKGEPLPAFDYHCPLLSLPLVFDTRLETIPATVPYLRAPAERVSHWEARLGPKTAPRVGIAWSGRPKHKNDHNRSLALSTLAPLLRQGIRIISVQKDVRPGDRDFLERRGDIMNCGAALTDFADTAALISLLDLVISVDTSVAHLAGALGKPVWVLLPFSPDWRWLLARDDSPWYPTARLFRQSSIGGWNGVISHVVEECKRMWPVGTCRQPAYPD